jgi:CBS domain-containing protein
MATSQTEVESQVVELATEAFKAFCDDIAGMFGVGMECEQQEVRAETVAGLKKCFRKLVAVNVVDARGALEGTFQLIFDQEGLFTLGGVIVMLPEQKILTNRRDPSPELAASMVDAVAEAGNLLVGSWDRIFREELKGHGHFQQRLPAFVGKPWDAPEAKIGLGDGPLVYVQYEMAIGSYQPFTCGVIFPKTLFGSQPGSKPASGDATQEAENLQDRQTSPEKTASKEPDMPQDSDSEEYEQEPPATEEARAGEEAAAKQESAEPQAPAPAAADANRGDAEDLAEGKTGPAQPGAAQKSAKKKKAKRKRRAAEKSPAANTDAKETAQDTPAPAAASDDVSRGGGEKAAEIHADSRETGEAQTRDDGVPEPEQPDAIGAPFTEEDAAPSQEHTGSMAGKVSEAIRKMTQSSAALPGESARPVVSETTVRQAPGGLLSICARDIMKGGVVWANPDQTVQQAFAKMQQHNTGYILVGADGVLEGIISRSDITGALSPYLRSLFAKWRRPLDDATLKIKIKWIMSRPVRTIQPQTPLPTIMENVCRFGGRALPVVDEQGKVQGLITVFDVFQTLLNTCADVSTVGKTPQMPPLT